MKRSETVKRITAAALLCAMLASSAACGKAQPSANDVIHNFNYETTASGDAGTAGTAAETEPDPFETLDFNGREVRMLVSSYQKGGLVSSYSAIVGGEEVGEVVADSVYNRNLKAEETLNIKLKFTENDQNCLDIPATVNKLVQSGEDAYDLIIHDLFPLATLSVQNSFTNVFQLPYLDFDQPWWYESYMKDVSFSSSSKRYILAGDYFIDILRSAHALYFNKGRFNDLYGDPSALYQLVLDGGWTQDKFLEYIPAGYSDINGNAAADDGDMFGFGTVGYIGPVFPWVIASDLTFLKYDSDGAPSFDMNNERSAALLVRLNEIFHNDAAFDYGSGPTLFSSFTSGNLLFCGYNRVASIENYRDAQIDIGIIPYPKMDEAQKNYITSSHDTSSVGVIPITCAEPDAVAAALEFMSRESSENVIPAYYETALKTKYVRDSESAQMLDIIRYNIACVFPHAFGSYCGDFPIKKLFTEPLEKKSTDFVSAYEKYEPGAQKKLDQLWEEFSNND